MRIGIVVDGVSEYESLPHILRRLADESGHVYPKVIKADIQPLAPFPVIARACCSAIGVFEGRGFDRIIILLDRKTRPDCPGEIARVLCSLLAGKASFPITVVVKDRCFENWLVADLDALAGQPRRFHLTSGRRRSVDPNKADSVDAAALMRAVVVGRYDKVEDSKRVLSRAMPDRMARNSRSFRKFMRELEHPTYRHQSAVP